MLELADLATPKLNLKHPDTELIGYLKNQEKAVAPFVYLVLNQKLSLYSEFRKKIPGIVDKFISKDELLPKK